MEQVRAIEIPISRDVDKVFDDYFEQRPPFSAKKKSEFPDAFVVSSLVEKARAIGKKIYVVSGDPDLRACCENVNELIVADSMSEIISRATVTKAIHDNLLRFIQGSGYVRSQLENSLYKAKISIEGRYGYDGITNAESTLVDVDQITILSSNVISREGKEFTCEIEFEACLILELNLTMKSRSPFGGDDYESRRFHLSHSHAQVFYAEVVIYYDADEPGESEVASVYCDPAIEIDPANVDQLSRRRF
jgi:hypothetical protein